MDLQKQSPTILLIHGAWHGAWCWKYLTPLLEKSGFLVLSPDLPGRNAKNDGSLISLNDHVESISHLITKQNNSVFLVGHSYGGVIASQVAQNLSQYVNGIAYISAFVLKDKQSLFDVVIDNVSEVSGSLIFSENYLDLDKKIAEKCFYNHCPSSIAQWAAQQLCKEPLKAMQTPIHVSSDRYGKIKKYYFLCENDQATLPAFQEKMCAQFSDMKIVRINSDHSPFLSQPANLANQLMNIINRSITA